MISIARILEALAVILFVGGTKNALCRKQWSGVSCLVAISNDPIKKRPQECEQDWGMFTLSRSGETDMECYGDFPFKVNADILSYGKNHNRRRMEVY